MNEEKVRKLADEELAQVTGGLADGEKDVVVIGYGTIRKTDIMGSMEGQPSENSPSGGNQGTVIPGMR